jgi:hypothetical protein
MRTLFLSFALLTGCTHAEKASAPLPVNGKPGAPVSVTSQFDSTNKLLNVRFEAAAKDVSFTVTGLDSLGVSMIPRAKAQVDFAAGETHDIELAFEKSNPNGTVALNVTGLFNGAKQTKVITFNIGTVPKMESAGTVVTDNDGQTLKIKVVK